MNKFLTGTCLCFLLPWTVWAQSNYGRVLDATPIYEEVAIPEQTCTEIAKQQRCEISTHIEERLLGYDVLYEYQGQQHMQRMAEHPGKRIPVQTSGPSYSYGSKDRSSAAVATPGKKSYGSTAPGASVVESIQYQPDELDPLINLNMRPPLPHHRR